jgi:hypothetical protein
MDVNNRKHTKHTRNIKTILFLFLKMVKVQRHRYATALFNLILIVLGWSCSISSAFNSAPSIVQASRIISLHKPSTISFLPTNQLSPHESSHFQLNMSENNNDDGVPCSPLDRPVLAFIDATAILIFATIGKASHASDGTIDLIAVTVTALPFLLSWFVTAPLLGCYTPGATSDIKSAVFQTAKGWIIAVPLGCVLRGVIKGYVPPMPFVIVTLISTLIILGIGRSAYTALSEIYTEMF